jgi:hypothetical protein
MRALQVLAAGIAGGLIVAVVLLVASVILFG